MPELTFIGDRITSADGTLPVNVDGGGLGDNVATSAGILNVMSRQWLSNGTGWDRVFNNVQGTLLASATRNTTTYSPTQSNFNARGLILWLNITALVGTTPGAQVQILATDPVSGQGPAIVTFPIVTATGTYIYMIYPGGAAGGSSSYTASAQIVFPRTWIAAMGISGTTPSVTASLGYCLII